MILKRPQYCPTLNSHLITELLVTDEKPGVLLDGANWDLPNLQTFKHFSQCDQIPNAFPLKSEWNSRLPPSITLVHGAPYIPASISNSLPNRINCINRDVTFRYAGNNPSNGNSEQMFFAPGQNPYLLNDPKAYTVVISSSPSPSESTAEPLHDKGRESNRSAF